MIYNFGSWAKYFTATALSYGITSKFYKTHEEIYFSEVKISEEVCLIFLRVIFN
jgi:hypothetical protein